MTTRPLSLDVEVHVSDHDSGQPAVRMSIGVADQIHYDDQRDGSCCVMVGQSERFPSWNPVLLPVVAEVDRIAEGNWIQLPRNLDGLHLIDLDQPWDLLVVDTITAKTISVTLDPAARLGRSRRQAASDSQPDPDGKMFVTISGDELRVDDADQGRELVVDSSGAWPSVVRLTDRGKINELKVHCIDSTKTTRVQHRKARGTGDRKHSTIVLVDCSGSMDHETESGESRLDIARNLVYDRFEELFDDLSDADSLLLDRCAIVAYGANMVRLYPTGDEALGPITTASRGAILNSIRHLHSGLLDECGLGRHLSDMPMGLMYAGYLLEEGRKEGQNHQILLITDGESEQLYEEPDNIGTKRIARSPSIAQQLNRLGITVSTIQILDDGGDTASRGSASAPDTTEPGKPAEPGTPAEPGPDSPEVRRTRTKEVAQRGHGQSLTSLDGDALAQILAGG
jgi:hypothetical protein